MDLLEPPFWLILCSMPAGLQLVAQAGRAALLQEWLSGRAVTSIEGKPEEVDRPQTLYNLCKAVDFLHARSLVHGCLAPDALMWFAPLKQWKLIGFGNWAKSQEPMRISYDLRYAAPELLHADLVGVSPLFRARREHPPGSGRFTRSCILLLGSCRSQRSARSLEFLTKLPEILNCHANNLSNALKRHIHLIATKNGIVAAF